MVTISAPRCLPAQVLAGPSPLSDLCSISPQPPCNREAALLTTLVLMQDALTSVSVAQGVEYHWLVSMCSCEHWVAPASPLPWQLCSVIHQAQLREPILHSWSGVALPSLSHSQHPSVAVSDKSKQGNPGPCLGGSQVSDDKK